ncbi:hypothetical protein phytr_6360 [Candidatus Phycorickettsia trachydisci]|uniref:Uncharacterized protein n=1 Tax=Candidatus Phycorickettsia trachydisci TaxID=2115978 RepID=A0A2P1P8J3_9RICK|nr:hypothetical protein [Candidatus Phycorickettsia trachydisci]AVP87577.1 hypothetical protein phytr_6360 [Candidatus Phycorickettsia trachydisci]
MKNKLTLSLLLTSLLASSAFAGDEGAFGLREEDADMARKTLHSIRPSLDDAMRKVTDILYPNLQTYSIQTILPIASTTILMDLIGTTSGKVASNSRVSTSAFNVSTTVSGVTTTTNTYKTNPYIARLAIIETGLRVQLKFVSASTGVADNPGTTAKVPIFELFFGKRIVMIPIFNVAYDSSGNNVTAKDTEISAWECLSDADEGISTSGTTISEGMRSVVSMGGGDLGSCQFISAANLDTIWAAI